MGKYVISDVISLTMYDKDGNPVWHTEDVDAVETESESISYSYGEPKIGDHIYLEASRPNSVGHMLIDGFYGGNGE